MPLRTDYTNDILDTSKNTERKYNIKNSNGTIVEENVTFEDVTEYSQEGSRFGATDINVTNEEVNKLNQNLNDIPNNAPYHGTIGFYAGQSWVLVVPISTYIIQNYNITNVGNVTLEGSGATLTVTRMDKKNNALICVLSGSSDVGNVGSVNLSFTKKN